MGEMRALRDELPGFIAEWRRKWQIAPTPAPAEGDAGAARRPRDAAPDDGYPFCFICAGWRRVPNHRVAPDLQPEDAGFGEMVPCPECGAGYAAHREGKLAVRRQERARERIAQLQHTTALGRLSNMTFDTFRPNAYQSIAYERARAFVEQPYGYLTLTGPTGTGKTHLAASIALAYAERHGDVLYYTATELLARIYETFGRPSWERDDDAGAVPSLTDTIKAASLLVIDELGAESGTPDMRMRLYDIIGSRYDEARPTVIVSNLSIAQLRDVDPRIVSRLGDPAKCVLVVVNGTDMRASGLDAGGGERFARKRKVDGYYKAGAVLICPVCGCRPCPPDCPEQMVVPLASSGAL